MKIKRNLVFGILILFCKVGISQNIQPPKADSLFNEKVKYIKDLIDLQEYDQAINDLKNLVLNNDNELKKGYYYFLLYFSYSSKGDIEANAKNYIEAIQLYNSALKYIQINNEFLNDIDFPPFETYTSRGICYSKLKDYKTAIFDFNSAISLSPKNGLALYCRGVVYHNLGDLNKACSDYLNAYKYGYPVETRLIEGCNSLN